MSQENVEIVKAIFAAWNDRNPQEALSRIDPNVEIDMTGVSFPGMAVVDGGHEGLAPVGAFVDAWESLEYFPDNFIEAGDHVIVSLRMAGRGRESGVPVELRVACVYTIRNGLVIRWLAFDTLAAAASAVSI